MLTVELSSEARLYRYLTCGGNSSENVCEKEDNVEKRDVDTADDEGNFETCEEAHNRMAGYRVLPALVMTKWNISVNQLKVTKIIDQIF